MQKIWKLVLFAETESDLTTKLGSMAPKALGRNVGDREQSKVELCTLRKYLSLKIVESVFEFPLTIFYGDRPDIKVEANGKVTGIEVTEAIWPRVAKGRQIAYEMDLNSFSLGELARINSIVEDKSGAIKTHFKGGNANVRPFINYEPEEEMFVLLDQILTMKLNRLNAAGFELFPRNDLLIYENSGLPCIQWKYVNVAGLRERNTKHAGKRFDQIIIISDEELIYVM